MHVGLTQELTNEIERLVSTGRYSGTDAALTRAAELLIYEESRLLQQEELVAAVQIGIAAADRGEVSPLDMNEIKRLARARHESRLRE